MAKKDYTQLLEKTLREIEILNYPEQFLDLFPDFLVPQLPLAGLRLFFLNRENTYFVPYSGVKSTEAGLAPVGGDSNLVAYLKNSQHSIVMKNETDSRRRFFEKDVPQLFGELDADIIIPLFSLEVLYGFVVIKATAKTYKELEGIESFFRILANVLIPLIANERIQVESDRNYYKIFRMDRLAMVGELAASAAHEIKNPLAGISTFLKYFSELEDFRKADIEEELGVMKQSVYRIDEIVKSLLSFSKFPKKRVGVVGLMELVDSSLSSIALKIPDSIRVVREINEALVVESDFQHLQQVLINIIFNAVEAIGSNEGEITIRGYVTGRDQLPSEEMFNLSVTDNGPGIDETFREKLFQPFQTTKEEGTGLGLYTCYGLMKSLGGEIKLSSTKKGTTVVLRLPYSFDDEEVEE